MFELKTLSPDSIDAALAKVERYRLLNEPREAESICRDILEIDSGNHQALVGLILALTDQIKTKGRGCVDEARQRVDGLSSEYERAYYRGIIEERRAKAQLARDKPGSGFIAYEMLREAMTWYEQAAGQRPPGNDAALLRWNTCARLIMEEEHVCPQPEDDFQPLLE